MDQTPVIMLVFFYINQLNIIGNKLYQKAIGLYKNI